MERFLVKKAFHGKIQAYEMLLKKGEVPSYWHPIEDIEAEKYLEKKKKKGENAEFEIYALDYVDPDKKSADDWLIEKLNEWNEPPKTKQSNYSFERWIVEVVIGDRGGIKDFDLYGEYHVTE